MAIQKLIFANLVFLIAIPACSTATTCIPYNNVNYTLQANSASGTLTKSQSCTNGSYSISAQINVSKAFFSKQINQVASGTYASPNTIRVQSFSSSNNNIAFTAGDTDPLSLVLYLSSSLNANRTDFPVIPFFYNGNTISIQYVSDASASVTTAAGDVVPATQVTCSSSDNAEVFDYFFSQDATAMMLEATSTENGTQTLSAVINSYP